MNRAFRMRRPLPGRQNECCRCLVSLACVLLTMIAAADAEPPSPLAVLPPRLSGGQPKTEMMSTWLKQRAIAAIDRREEQFETLKNEQIASWQTDRREFLIRQLGGFPSRTPLHAVVTGKLVVDDYRIEKVRFESQPGLHVTANLYLPQGDGPFPGVLHPTGHSANAKNRALYQEASIAIVKGGCAVLCYDPIGQGERDQAFRPNGEPYASTIQHTLINHGSHLLGSNVARTMVWDGMRAIDYLQSRNDIIADRIGCTGISGGGTNTSYLMAIDERIVAAAPGCYLTGYRSLFETIGPQDAEQNIPGQLAFGLDHSDYVLIRLPKPTLIMAATRDYFDIHGAWALFREGKRIATRLGASHRVELLESDTDHGFPPAMRVGASNWMRRWLLDQDVPVRPEALTPLPEEQLNVTPTAQVLQLPGARSIFELNAERNAHHAPSRTRNSQADRRAHLRRRIRRLIGARAISMMPEPRFVGTERTLKSDDRSLIAYTIESEPGIVLPAYFVPFGDSPAADSLVLIVSGAGAENVITTGKAAQVMDEKKCSALVVDLRGFGETRPAGRGGFAELFGTDWKDVMAANLLGISHVGMRSEDVWQIVRLWRKKTSDHLTVHLVGIGEASIAALHAAVLEPSLFESVQLSGMVRSWGEVVESSNIRGQHSNLVYGALKEYDLPMLRSLLGDKLHASAFVLPNGDSAP